MYTDFYQLTERPFNVTPDPKFLYLNARYREAIASLNYGITQRRGFITLIGEAGTGKTTLLKKLLEDLDQKTKTVFIFNTNVSFEEILEYIFAEFDLPVHNGKKLYMLQRLNAFLLEELRNGGNVALLIDEAQDLEFSVLEDLRLLSNLETAKEKILQIVLSGQPELGQKLSNPVLRQLRQRIGINCRLLPLSRDEVTEYIHFRLQAAGSPDLKLFTREAEDEIYHLSRGIPRLVNVVCDNALVIGYALGKKRIGADVISEAAADLLPAEATPEPASVETPIVVAPPPAPSTAARQRWRSRIGLGALLGATLAVGMWSVGRTALEYKPPVPPPMTPTVPLEVIRPGSPPRGLGVEEPLAAPPRPAGLAAAPAGIARDENRAPSVREQPEPEAWSEPEAEDAAIDLPSREGPPAAGHEPLPEGRTSVAASRDFPVDDRQSDTSVEQSWDQAAVARPPAIGDAPSSGPPGRLRYDGDNVERLVVQVGDSLSAIARRKYGQSSYTVLDLLKLSNPEVNDVDLITPGQTVRLPDLRGGFPVLTDGNGNFSLLVFSTPNQQRAQNLSKALRSRGFNAEVEESQIGAGKRIARVTVGGATSRNDVQTIGRELQQLFRDDTRVAQLGE